MCRQWTYVVGYAGGLAEVRITTAWPISEPTCENCSHGLLYKLPIRNVPFSHPAATRHLKLAVDELGFTGIRGHGLLDDDMSAAQSTHPDDFSFYNVDQVFDYLVELKIKPVVELSFMPSALAKCHNEDCHYAFGDHGGYKGLIMPPADFEDWYTLVKSLGESSNDANASPRCSN